MSKDSVAWIHEVADPFIALAQATGLIDHNLRRLNTNRQRLDAEASKPMIFYAA